MNTTQQLYETYRQKMQRISAIRSASAVLQWDQETYLPSGGAHFRRQQITTLSELVHQFFSEESLGNVLNELMSKDDLSAGQKKAVELTIEDYNKNKKSPAAFVSALSDQVNK